MIKLVVAGFLWTCVCLIIATLYLCACSKVDSGERANAHEASETRVAPEKKLPLISLASEKLICDSLETSPSEAVMSMLDKIAAAATVVVIAIVKTDAEQRAVEKWYADHEIAYLIGPHHLLFCETPTSRASIVRQLNPNIHLEVNREAMAQMNKVATVRAIEVHDVASALTVLDPFFGEDS